jgi:hypothetical protein
VDGRPRLDDVIGIQNTRQDGIFQAEFHRLTVRDVGVHARGVRVEDSLRVRSQRGVFLFGHLTPAERAQELIGLHLPLAEHLGEASRTDVPPEVHLPETILRVDVSLREEQVVPGGGVDVRDAHLVAVDVHGAVQPRDLHLPVRLRE